MPCYDENVTGVSERADQPPLVSIWRTGVRSQSLGINGRMARLLGVAQGSVRRTKMPFCQFLQMLYGFLMQLMSIIQCIMYGTCQLT